MPVIDFRGAKGLYYGGQRLIGAFLGATAIWKLEIQLRGRFLKRYASAGSMALTLDEAQLQAQKIAFLDFIQAVIIRGKTYPVVSHRGGSDPYATASFYFLGNVQLSEALVETVYSSEEITLVIKRDSFFQNPSGARYENITQTSFYRIQYAAYYGGFSIDENVFKTALINPYNVTAVEFKGRRFSVQAVSQSSSQFKLSLELPSDFPNYSTAGYYEEAGLTLIT